MTRPHRPITHLDNTDKAISALTELQRHTRVRQGEPGDRAGSGGRNTPGAATTRGESQGDVRAERGGQREEVVDVALRTRAGRCRTGRTAGWR